MWIKAPVTPPLIVDQTNIVAILETMTLRRSDDRRQVSKGMLNALGLGRNAGRQ